jgi:hypothetical protein
MSENFFFNYYLADRPTGNNVTKYVILLRKVGLNNVTKYCLKSIELAP